MQERECHVDEFFGTQDERACIEGLLLKVREVEAEVEWSGDVDSEVVQL